MLDRVALCWKLGRSWTIGAATRRYQRFPGREIVLPDIFSPNPVRVRIWGWKRYSCCRIPFRKTSAAIRSQLIDQGRFGGKSGHGVFEYPTESVDQRIAARDQTYLALVKLLGMGQNVDPSG